MSLVISLLLTMASANSAEAVRGDVLKIGGIDNLVWIQGPLCKESGSCEGVIYKDVHVQTVTGIAVLPRLVLLSPETTDCENFDPYWAVHVLVEKFAPQPQGRILNHPYAKIEISTLDAVQVDLGSMTDKSIGYASSGMAYVGRMTATVLFDRPFAEIRHLASLCKKGVEGSQYIDRKVIHYD